MKAIVVTSFGGPENLELTEQPKPTPALGQVLVAVEAAGVSLADTLVRQGMQPDVQPGFTPGLEMAGTVVEVGESVDRTWLNNRVFAMAQEGIKSGCYAEFVVSDVDQLVPLSPTITAAQAVSVGMNALSAEFAIRRAQVQAGEQVLVRGASGGIGVMLVQLAARRGATVTVSTSSSERAKRLLKLGASHAVDRAGEPLGGMAPEMYDVVLDTVAGRDMLTFTDKLHTNGRTVLAGVAGGRPPAELATAIIDPRSLTFSVVSLDAVDEADRLATLHEIFVMVSRGELAPVIHEVLELGQTSEAHSELEAGKTFGKIVLEVAH